MSDLSSTDRVHAHLGKRGAFEGVARRHGRRRNPARRPPPSSLRTLTNQPRHSTQRWVEKCDRSVANSETPQHPDRPDRSRRARQTLPGREHQGRPRPHSRRPARLQPHRPDRRARDRLPQPATNRREPPHPPAAHQPQHHPSQSARTARHHPRQVAKAKPARNTPIPRPHAGFVISRPKTSD